jgi:hypothetical protein
MFGVRTTDHNRSANRSKRFADEFLIGERPISFLRVEERDAALHRCADQGDHFAPLRRRATVIIQAHASEADGRDFKTAAPETTSRDLKSLACTPEVQSALSPSQTAVLRGVHADGGDLLGVPRLELKGCDSHGDGEDLKRC